MGGADAEHAATDPVIADMKASEIADLLAEDGADGSPLAETS